MGIQAIPELQAPEQTAASASGNRQAQKEQNGSVFQQVFGKAMSSVQQTTQKKGKQSEKKAGNLLADDVQQAAEENLTSNAELISAASAGLLATIDGSIVQQVPTTPAAPATPATAAAQATSDNVTASTLPVIEPQTSQIADVVQLLAALPTENAEQTLITNVKDRLETAGQQFQQELTAMAADSAPEQAAEEPQQVETQPVVTEMAQAVVQAVEVPAQRAQAGSDEKAEPSSQKDPASTSAEPVLLNATDTKSSAAETETNSNPNSGFKNTEAQGMSEKSKVTGTETPREGSVTTAFQTVMTAQTDHKADLTELSAAVDRAVQQFETDFQGMETDGSTMKINLQPKELGSISITLAAGLNGVTAKIQTSNADTASLISNQVQRMIQAMEDKGVRVQNVDVVYSQMTQQNAANSGSGNGAEQYQRQAPTVVPLFSEEPVSGESALEDYENLTGRYVSAGDVDRRMEYRV